MTKSTIELLEEHVSGLKIVAERFDKNIQRHIEDANSARAALDDVNEQIIRTEYSIAVLYQAAEKESA